MSKTKEQYDEENKFVVPYSERRGYLMGLKGSLHFAMFEILKTVKCDISLEDFKESLLPIKSELDNTFDNFIDGFIEAGLLIKVEDGVYRSALR